MKMKKRIVWAMALNLLGVGLLTASSALAQESTDPPTHASYTVLQDQPDRMIAVLPNRMILIAQEKHTAPVVCAQVWVKTGSIYEQEHVGAGMSHFLEHLLAGGTTQNRSERESAKMLGRIGADFNAATGLANVHYYINTTRGHADQAVDLLTDWMQNALIPQTEYEREREVIQREFEFGSADSRRIFWKLTQQARYQAHPARHPTIGYLDDFLAVSRDQIHDFYKRMYAPNNMIFIVVGDIDRKKTIDRLATLWRDQPPSVLPDLRFPIEPSLRETRTVKGKAAIDRPRLRLAWPSVKLTEPGDYELDLLAAVLGQGESSRLVAVVRDQMQAVNTIEAYHSSASWGAGYFGVDMEVAAPADARDDEAVQRAEQLVLEQIAQIAEKGVGADELARAKRKVLASLILGAQSASDLADRLARDLISTGDLDYRRRYVRAVEAINTDDLRKVAREYLHEKPHIRVVLAPLGSDGQPTATTRAAEAAADPAIAYQPVMLDNRELISRLSDSLEHGRLASKSAVPQQAVHFVLPNGLRLLVEPDDSIPAVAIQFYQLGGLLNDQPGREGIANAVSAMLLRGTKKRSAEQLARELDDLGAVMDASCGYNTAFVHALCLKEDWSKTADLLADVVLNPRFDREQWSNMQRRLRASMARQKDGWSGELGLHFREVFYQRHPWATTPLGRDEVIAQVTAHDLQEFYKDHLGADQSIVVVTGDVDPHTVYARFTSLLGKLPRRAGQRFVVDQPATPSAGVTTHVSEKPLSAVRIGFGPGVSRDHPDYPAARVLAAVMSSFPAGWLDMQLRGDGPGLVYAVGAAPSAGLARGDFSILFNTSPSTVVEAISRSMHVVRRARNDLVRDVDLQRAKAHVLAQEALRRQTLADRAAELALDELYGLGAGETQRFEQAVEQLDAQTLRIVARIYLRNPVVVVVGPDAPDVRVIENMLKLDQ